MKQDVKWYQSISSELLRWFLALSILPIIAFSFISYKTTTESLYNAVSKDLEHSALSYIHFINNWFEYRYIDIQHLAQQENTRHFMNALSTGHKNLKKDPGTYIKSPSYQALLQKHQHDFVESAKHYSYIYDIFLIDLEGNILFSVAKENDLATSLQKGIYSNTMFAKSYRETLADGKMHFSDFEHYAPSQGKVYGFITSSITDKDNKAIGIFALQFKPNRIFNQFTSVNNTDNGIVHYLISNADYKLRSPIHSEAVLLTKSISPENVKKFRETSTSSTKQGKQSYQSSVRYTGPNGQEVIGIHHPLDILGVKWSLISEFDEDKALSAVHSLSVKMAWVVFFLIIIVIAVSYYIARRITRPIQGVVQATTTIAKGKKISPVSVKSSNEIGQLADAFNNMIKELEEHDKSLQEQKLALDAHAIVAITDVKGTISYVNQKFADISGYSIQELIGQNHRLLNSGLYEESFWKEMYQTISHGKVWHGEIRNKAKNGHFYWVDTTIVPFLNEAGKPESYTAIRADITERKEAEEKLIQANQQTAIAAKEVQKALHDLQEQKLALDAHAIVAITDVKGTISYVNQKFADISGYSIQELIGQNHRLLNSGLYEESFWKEMYQTISHGKVWHGEIRNKAKNGHFYWVDTTIVPFLNEAGKPESYTAIRADITERKEAEEKLIEAKEQAEIAAQTKAEFLASMSHEIRTPMNGVIGMLGLLQNSELNESQLHQARIAQSSAQSLLTLINDILDFSKVEAGKLELENIEINLLNELADFTESMAFKAIEKDIELILDTKNISSNIIITDPGRLRQILNNLVGNAIKFTADGEVLITCSLDTGDETQAKLSISIKDSGIGIPKEKLPDLFNPFTQVDASTTRQFGGTGLGLSIVKKLTELMGGGVRVTSELGQGSTFSFYICIGLGKELDSPMPHVDTEGTRALIVDDNEVNREVLHGQLAQWGIEVFEAKNSETALLMCEQSHLDGINPPFDIALIDMHMPDGNGEDLGKEIRKTAHYDNMKMVMMTSLGSRKDAKSFAEIGFNGFFTKPTTTKDLFKALNVLIDDSDALKEVGGFITRDTLGALDESDNTLPWPESTKILLVEDNITNQIVANGILETFGLQADVANNGEIALEMLKEADNTTKPYTIVLMDCQMPVMDGYSATGAIREGKAGEENKTIPVIAMTANAMKGDKENCIVAGMDDYLTKPINPDILEEVLNKWLIR